MGDAQTSETTQLLRAWASGDQAALDQLTPRVYQELRRMAGHFMQNERPGRTLQTTALVHEAYLRLVDRKDVDWKNRSHFFAVAAQTMRRILVDYARKHRAAKRGDSAPQISLEQAAVFAKERAPEHLLIDELLTKLARLDPRGVRIVELRYFAGLSVGQTGEVIGISPATVKREWSVAKAWLMREMKKCGITDQK